MVAVPFISGSVTITRSATGGDSTGSAREEQEMSWSAKGGDSLTKGEAEVLGLVDSGLSNREIAAALSIAVGTVKCHLIGAMKSLRRAIGSRGLSRSGSAGTCRRLSFVRARAR